MERHQMGFIERLQKDMTGDTPRLEPQFDKYFEQAKKVTDCGSSFEGKFRTVLGYEEIRSEQGFCYYKLLILDIPAGGGADIKPEDVLVFDVKRSATDACNDEYESNGYFLLDSDLSESQQIDFIRRIQGFIRNFQFSISGGQELLKTYSFWRRFFNENYYEVGQQCFNKGLSENKATILSVNKFLSEPNDAFSMNVDCSGLTWRFSIDAGREPYKLIRIEKVIQ